MILQRMLAALAAVVVFGASFSAVPAFADDSVPQSLIQEGVCPCGATMFTEGFAYTYDSNGYKAFLLDSDGHVIRECPICHNDENWNRPTSTPAPSSVLVTEDGVPAVFKTCGAIIDGFTGNPVLCMLLGAVLAPVCMAVYMSVKKGV